MYKNTIFKGTVMKNVVFVLFLFVSNILFAQIAQKDSVLGSGIVFGANHAFTITAPAGWVLDNKSGIPQGLQAVFYPIGGSWEGSLAVMYANAVEKNENDGTTFNRVIYADTSKFMAEHKEGHVAAIQTLTTKDNKKAKVIMYIYSNYEAAAFIDEPKVVSMLVLTARSEKEFKNAVPAFKELVASYFYLTSDVIHNKAN
jgi:hypothetical protein